MLICKIDIDRSQDKGVKEERVHSRAWMSLGKGHTSFLITRYHLAEELCMLQKRKKKLRGKEKPFPLPISN